MIIGKADTQVETNANKAAESSETWTDAKLLLEVEKAAFRKLPSNMLTAEALNLQKNKLFSAVAASWKSSMGMAHTARLEPELVERLESAIAKFTDVQANKVLSCVTSYSKRSQVDVKNRQVNWKLTLVGKELMDLNDQKTMILHHITDKERRLKDLYSKPGDWIDAIKECEATITEYRIVSEAIAQKIAAIKTA